MPENGVDFVIFSQSVRPWQARPERRIAAVAHWGVIYALTGARDRRGSAVSRLRIEFSGARSLFIGAI
jgi:hypothetical protein